MRAQTRNYLVPEMPRPAQLAHFLSLSLLPLNMNLRILDHKVLADVPSASGIEIIGDTIYMMGDDSPWLFRMNRQFQLEEKIQIGDITKAIDGKIPKPEKPDLEAMAAFGQDLLLFGSGSKSPQRDVLVWIDPAQPLDLKKYPLVKFYDHLCKSADFTRKDLNIEAAVIIDEILYLFNRGKNQIIKINARSFLEYVKGFQEIPTIETVVVTLPAINGIGAGFSGAAATPDKTQILFTASVENTSNWIDDGEVLGSFIGLLPIDSLKDNCVPPCLPITDQKKNTLNIKVESVAVHHSISSNSLHLMMVTDTDGSASEVIEAQLEW